MLAECKEVTEQQEGLSRAQPEAKGTKNYLWEAQASVSRHDTHTCPLPSPHVIQCPPLLPATSRPRVGVGGLGVRW